MFIIGCSIPIQNILLDYAGHALGGGGVGGINRTESVTIVCFEQVSKINWFCSKQDSQALLDTTLPNIFPSEPSQKQLVHSYTGRNLRNSLSCIQRGKVRSD